MGCPEWRVAAFVGGELSPEEERAFDRHLLECEDCWQAVQEDRLGRLAAVQLRGAAAADLEDRVRFAISVAGRAPLAETPPRPRRWGRGRPMVAIAACAVAVAATLAITLSGGSRGDPPQIAAVMAMITPGRPPAALQAGEGLVIAGQPMTVRAFIVDGVEVVAATSSRPFALPSGSHLLSGSSPKAWLASSGHLSLYGVNQPGAGRQSMFIVAPMPMAELPGVAAHLKLI